MHPDYDLGRDEIMRVRQVGLNTWQGVLRAEEEKGRDDRTLTRVLFVCVGGRSGWAGGVIVGGRVRSRGTVTVINSPFKSLEVLFGFFSVEISSHHCVAS
jgi:hypothetical protein